MAVFTKFTCKRRKTVILITLIFQALIPLGDHQDASRSVSDSLSSPVASRVASQEVGQGRCLTQYQYCLSHSLKTGMDNNCQE